MTPRARPRHGRKKRWVKLLVALAALLVIAYPFLEAASLTTEYADIVDSSLPAGLSGLKIVYVTDIHMGFFRGADRARALIARINALRPDIVLFGGDYATDSASAIRFFETIPRVQARVFVGGVLGNNDRTAPESNLRLLREAMQAANVTPLVNEVRSLKIAPDTYLRIAGVDDVYNGHPDVKGVAAQVRQDDYVIFLSHSPDIMPDAQSVLSADGSQRWFDLALFGHTHGGQIRLLGFPLFNKLLSGDRYLSGWQEENRARVLTSNGVGTSVVPARLFTPPQIHLITLKKK